MELQADIVPRQAGGSLLVAHKAAEARFPPTQIHHSPAGSTDIHPCPCCQTAKAALACLKIMASLLHANMTAPLVLHLLIEEASLALNRFFFRVNNVVMGTILGTGPPQLKPFGCGYTSKARGLDLITSHGGLKAGVTSSRITLLLDGQGDASFAPADE
jgi:hypothetical protein